MDRRRNLPINPLYHSHLAENPLPDGDTVPAGTVEDYYGTWHTDPPDKPLPLRWKVYAALVLAIMAVGVVIGVMRG